jgi:hypothetical protein
MCLISGLKRREQLSSHTPSVLPRAKESQYFWHKNPTAFSDNMVVEKLHDLYSEI